MGVVAKSLSRTLSSQRDGSPQTETILQKMNIKPTPIYKYVSLDIAESIAISSTLKFTNPLKFNDPFDCDISRLKFDLSQADSIVRSEVQNLREKFKNYPEVNDIMLEKTFRDAQIDKIKRSSVCCFSCIETNLLMWAHYSNKHYGACLIFDNTLENKFPSVPDARFTEMIVDYSEFSQINYCESKINGIKNLFGKKSLDWEYECEYRLVILEREGLIRFNSTFLTGVIFGIKVTDEEIERFKNNSKREKLNLVFKRAIQDLDSLKIVEI